MIVLIFSLLNSTASSDLRYSIELCDGEKAFLQKRKKIVLEAMKKYLGERGPKNLGEVRCSYDVRSSWQSPDFFACC